MTAPRFMVKVGDRSFGVATLSPLVFTHALCLAGELNGAAILVHDTKNGHWMRIRNGKIETGDRNEL